MNATDFNTVVSWLFSQLESVISLIHQYYILRLALYVPIAGFAVLAVFYLLQSFGFIDINKHEFGGSIHNSGLSGLILNYKNHSFEPVSIAGKGVKVSTASRSLVKKKRKELAAIKRKQEQDERDQKRLKLMKEYEDYRDYKIRKRYEDFN